MKNSLASGTFWMVYDASGFYVEYVLCPTRAWARDVRQERADKDPDVNVEWKIIKIRVVPVT